MSEVSIEVEKEPEIELKDFSFTCFVSLNEMQNSFATLTMTLTEEEMNEREVVIGILPKRETSPVKELKNPSTMKRVLFYKGSPESMRATIIQSTVPLNGIKRGKNIEIFSKVFEYNGKCAFCNFNHTEDNNLMCYQCIKSFNDCKKFISTEEEISNND